MTTELAPLEGVLVHPVTGEAKQLAEIDNADIRAGIEQLDALSKAVAEAKQKLAREAWHRKNAGNAVEAVEVTQRRQWHPGETGAALDKLIRDGDLNADRDTYLAPQQTYKPNARSLNQLVDYLMQEGNAEAAQVLLTARRDSVSAKVKA